MTVVVRASVKGLAELERGFGDLAKGRYRTRALDASAKRVVKVAQRDRFRHSGGAPVRGILTSRRGKAGLEGSVRIEQATRRNPTLRRVIFGKGGRHGPLHELGTKRLPKRPVLTPALGIAEPEFRGIFETEIRAELRNLGLA